MPSDFLMYPGGTGPVQLLDSNQFTPINPTTFPTHDGRRHGLRDRSVRRPAGRHRSQWKRSADLANSIASSSGKGVAIHRDGQGRMTVHRRSHRGDAHLHLRCSGQPSVGQGSCGNVSTFQYDAGHNLIAINDPRGIRAAEYVYDSDGRLISRHRRQGQHL